MRAHDHDGRRAALGGRGARAPRAARVVAALLAGGLIAAVPAIAATTVKPVAAPDASGDVADGGLDITRVQLGVGKDGRLRAAITLADEITPKDWLAASGQPGSVCLRAWTLTKPGTVPPDFLICASADSKGKLRASVAAEQVNAQPKRIASASVSRSSDRTLVLSFSRTSVSGGKATATSVIFAAEATRPGCARASCVDTAPDSPKTLTLTLKKPS